MSGSDRSMGVLKKILERGQVNEKKISRPEELVEKFLAPDGTKKTYKTQAKSSGRPRVEDHLKAKNFTLCLSPKYLNFLDNMQVKDKKIQGRGRKVRFIIDQFLELHRRQRLQMMVLKEVLMSVDKLLKSLSSQAKEGEKLGLSAREKAEITRVVGQFTVLIKVLGFTPKELHRLLPRNEWAIASFCLDWKKSSGVKR